MNKFYKPINLIKFENKICELFNNKKIKAPIHLYNGNEKQIIKIFRKVKKRTGYSAHGEVTINAY